MNGCCILSIRLSTYVYLSTYLSIHDYWLPHISRLKSCAIQSPIRAVEAIPLSGKLRVPGAFLQFGRIHTILDYVRYGRYENYGTSGMLVTTVVYEAFFPSAARGQKSNFSLEALEIKQGRRSQA